MSLPSTSRLRRPSRSSAREDWDGIIPSPDCSPSPSVLRLSPSLRWEQAREPLHQGIDGNRTCRIGPGMTFANAVRLCSREDVVICIVPCAAGRMRITEWAKGLMRESISCIGRPGPTCGGGGDLPGRVGHHGGGRGQRGRSGPGLTSPRD
ncbi:hypothetical protein QYE76_006302 [Lolium multiflorum]|uniref:Sialate O-acetylesterase domain-containing protein n=1 Tax=Lolium multiflorum TaxID=4521 RepID=A0AAD8RW35_LOLMU|nr:hypothetical protein QYE76_006302 [Lolium multiflorum]